MSTFLGIGLGPIQTGIFLSGAFKGGCKRLVVAEVNPQVVQAVRASGELTVNVAGSNRIFQERIQGVEIYNPTDAADLEKLKDAAAEATEIATALPSVNAFKHIASWLREGFLRQPQLQRFVYCAENNNHAAEFLHEEIGDDLPGTQYLNTVVGKMSKAVEPSDGVEPLSAGLPTAHLVEEFNHILISSVPGVEQRKVQGLYPQNNLLAYEEAKLYGHNAIHFMLAWYGKKRGCRVMSELAAEEELLQKARCAFIEESGKALCAKWNGEGELFTDAGFRVYAEDLLVRMVNPFLQDSVERITRDLPRKLASEDRVFGTIRVCLEQGIVPKQFVILAADCLSAECAESV